MASQIDREDAFRDMMNDCYPEVTLGEMSWEPARVLEEMDPIAFRCAVNDYEDSMLSDGQWFTWEDGNIYDEEEPEEDEEIDYDDMSEEEQAAEDARADAVFEGFGAKPTN